MTFLFSYGSNNPKQLGERIGRKIKESDLIGGYAQDHVLEFTGYSQNWDSSTANCAFSSGNVCYGYLTEVSEEELKIMDKYEGVPTVYRRQKKKIQTAHGEKIAIVYTKVQKQEAKAPGDKYFKAVLETMKVVERLME
jgi:gamma-glutamylcyclotransferase (GGCT)/AIG2-like uncharacterized protein YtfP